MRHFLLSVVLVAGCGEGRQDVPQDIATVAAVDLAEPVVDMAKPTAVDMAHPPACSMPAPGVYTDVVQIIYAPLSNPTMMANAQAITRTIVRNDGTLTRPSPAIPTPFEFHCDFTTQSIDSTTCMAPCCAGQAGSPTFYFDSMGWVMAVSGMCTFETTSAVSYQATVVDGAGTLIH